MTHHQQSWLVRLADRDARQSRLVGHSLKNITQELTPFLTRDLILELTPEITPNYVN